MEVFAIIDRVIKYHHAFSLKALINFLSFTLFVLIAACFQYSFYDFVVLNYQDYLYTYL